MVMLTGYTTERGCFRDYIPPTLRLVCLSIKHCIPFTMYYKKHGSIQLEVESSLYKS